jgi:hypothetical protein
VRAVTATPARYAAQSCFKQRIEYVSRDVRQGLTALRRFTLPVVILSKKI